ncbi:MAG: carbon-nitrogen family hydrolase, partial [Anaerolineae bacterium]|nr:carbon-nitrogen family hydrolase [Anaerolineae bacterium]
MQLTISLAQIDIALGDPDANVAKADEWTAEAKRRGSDIVVFPELWTTGCDWPNIAS